MKILFYRPEWGNRWIPYIEKALSEVGDVLVTGTTDVDKLAALSERADVLFSAWSNEIVLFWSQHFGEKRIVTFLRRYEISIPGLMNNIKWENIDKVIFVSEHIRRQFLAVQPGSDTVLIPNGVDTNDFTFRDRSPGYNIAFVAQVRFKKNFPLAAQILLALPKQYKIHQIGLPTDYDGQTVVDYVYQIGVGDRFIRYDPITSAEMNDWLEDKDYLLSPSIIEGNPNNIIEAMAKGIKPVVHNWQGASDQFPADTIFNSVAEAVRMITEPSYPSWQYRQWVEQRYSLDNFKKVAQTVIERN